MKRSVPIRPDIPYRHSIFHLDILHSIFVSRLPPPMPKTALIKLHRDWKQPDALKQIPTRDGYGEGLVELGKKDPNVYVICADLSESTRTQWFKDQFPDRFVQLGVSEQSLAAIAAGMALAGKKVWIASYACFSPGRNWEQVRTTACLQ